MQKRISSALPRASGGQVMGVPPASRPASGQSLRLSRPDSSRTAELIVQSSETVHSFLTQHGYPREIPGIRQIQTGLTMKQFIEVCNFLFSQLDCGLEELSQDAGLAAQQLTQAQQLLRYPDACVHRQIELRQCSQHPQWKKYAAFLGWLSDLAQYSVQVQAEMDGDGGDVELFIKEACMSESVNTILCSQNGVHSLGHLYRLFADSQSDEAALRRFIIETARPGLAEIKEAEARLNSQTTELDTRIQEYWQSLWAKADEMDLQLKQFQQSLAQLPKEIGISFLPPKIPAGSAVTVQSLLETQQNIIKALGETHSRLLARAAQHEAQLQPKVVEKTQQIDSALADAAHKLAQLQAEELAAQQAAAITECNLADFSGFKLRLPTLQQEAQRLEKLIALQRQETDEKLAKKLTQERQISQISQQLDLGTDAKYSEALELESKLRRRRADLEQLIKQEQFKAKEAELKVRQLAVQRENSPRLKPSTPKLSISQQISQEVAARPDSKRVAELKDRKATLQKELQQAKILLQKQHAVAASEEKRRRVELVQAMEAASAILLQVQQTRNNGRNFLEIARDKATDALRILQKE